MRVNSLTQSFLYSKVTDDVTEISVVLYVLKADQQQSVLGIDGKLFYNSSFAF